MIGLVVLGLASLASAALVAALVPAVAREVVAGMMGPMAAVAGSWGLVKRTARTNPAGVHAVMVGGFIVKMLFFGAYVVAVMQLPGLRAQPFMVSFLMYFVALYAAQAVMLKRLFAGVAR